MFHSEYFRFISSCSSPKSPAVFLDESSNTYEKILTPQNLHTPKFEQKGLMLMWPQKEPSPFYYNKELNWFMWIFAHSLYWLQITNFFPATGTVIFCKQPSWKYKPQLFKPENKDYIIEPDWDSLE